MGGTNFWGGTRGDDIFLAPSFDDRILEVRSRKPILKLFVLLSNVGLLVTYVSINNLTFIHKISFFNQFKNLKCD